MFAPPAARYKTSMKVRCSANSCPCEKDIDVEVFQTGTSQVIEHCHPIACEQCDHRWDMHSGTPGPPLQAEHQPAA
jgi:hypothetical protein